MYLNVVEYLKTHTLDELKEYLGIEYRRHPKYNNLVLLNYSQIDSPKDHPIVIECRGIILDEANNWKVVCFPFTRFFNHSEGHAAKIDWESAIIYHKLDGSMLNLWYYDNKWHCSTRGTPDASGPVNNQSNMTFQSLFWDTFNELGYSLPFDEDKDKTFVFELTSQYNQVVVIHNTPKVTLLGVKNCSTYQEYLPSVYGNKYRWEVVATHPNNDLHGVLEYLKAVDGHSMEGFVVVDKNFNRIKIKAESYILYHRLSDSSSGDLVDFVVKGEVDEFLAYFPKYKERVDKIVEVYNKLLVDIVDCWTKNKHKTSNRKDFALSVKGLPYASIMFLMLNGKYQCPKELIVKEYCNNVRFQNSFKELLKNLNAF